MSTDSHITISAALRLFQIRRSKLRRLLTDGEIEGAVRREGAHGQEWILPVASLEAMGFARRPDDATPARTQRYLLPAALTAVGVVLVLALVLLAQVGSGSDEGDGLATASDATTSTTASDASVTTSTGDDDVDAAFEDPSISVRQALRAVTSAGDEVALVGAANPEWVPAGRSTSEDPVSARFLVIAGEDDRAQAEAMLPDANLLLGPDDLGQAIWVLDRGPVSDTDPPDSVLGSDDAPPTVDPAPEDLETDLDRDDERNGEPGPAVATTSGQHTVVEGEHFWSIARSVVLDADATADQAAITAYWSGLIDANADQLVDAGNADLLLPGQVLELPPVPSG